MSISITIGTNKININNQTHYVQLSNYINNLEKNVIKGCELTVIIVDAQTGNFHQYVSKLSPKKWLLNNISYSLTCDETKKNMDNMFNEIVELLCLLTFVYNI